MHVPPAWTPCAPRAFLLFLALTWPWACSHGLRPGAGPAPDHVASQAVPQTARLPDGAVPKHYDLALTLDPNAPRFFGQVSISVELLEPQSTLWLHASGLDIERAAVVDGLGLRHKVQLVQNADLTGKELLRLEVAPEMPAGMATVYIKYSGAFSDALTGLYRTQADGRSYIESRLQPLSARRVLPCFDDPRFRTPFSVRLTVPDDSSCAFNTVAVGVRDAHPGHKVWAFETTPPLPPQLLGLVVGPLQAVTQQLPVSPQRPYTLDVHGYAPMDTARRLTYAMGRLGPLVLDLEAFVDMPYPFAKLALWAAPEQASRGIDNAALLSLRSWLLFVDGPQASYHQRRSLEMTLGQMLAQQWFGAWVGPGSCDDAWLGAAFANWRGLRAAAHIRPGMQFDLELLEGTHAAMAQDGWMTAARLREPCHDTADVLAAAAATAHTAHKGAALLTMFEHSLGKARMRDGVRTYLRRHAYQSTSTTRSLAALSDGANAPELPQAMGTFLNQTGVPEIGFAWRCSGTGAELTLSQERYRPLGGKATGGLWQLPVCFRVGAEGDDRPRRMTCVQLRDTSMTVPLHRCPASLVANADGAGYYRVKMNAEVLPAVLAAMTPALMAPTEYAATLDNFAAALAQGALPADVALGAISRGLSHPNPRIVRKALALLRSAAAQYVPSDGTEATRATWRRLLAVAQRTLVAQARGDGALVAPGRRLGAEADAQADSRDELSLLRHDITQALAALAQDSATQASLAHASAHWLDAREVHHELSPTPVAHTSSVRVAATLQADDVALALAHGARAFGTPFVQRLVALLAIEQDAEARRHILVALGAYPAPHEDEALWALAESTDMRPQERLPWLAALMSQPGRRHGTWQFIVSHIETLLPLLPAEARPQLIALGAELCQAPEEVQSFAELAPHIKDVPGGTWALAQARERSGLCHAQVSAQGAAVTAFFSGAGSSPAQ